MQCRQGPGISSEIETRNTSKGSRRLSGRQGPGISSEIETKNLDHLALEQRQSPGAWHLI